jgi:hypothetical protein
MRKAKEIPEEIFEHVKYDENSPSGLVWIKPKQGRRVGGIAGCKHKITGYWLIGFNGKIYFCHRVIYKIFNKINIQDTEIDHEDRNPDNNKIENLRIATRSEQNFNQGIRSNNTSGIKGIHWHKRYNKWVARISVNGKRHHLGYFDDKYEAERAVIKKREELHGDFASNK